MRRQAGDLGSLGVEVPASPLRGRTGSDLPSLGIGLSGPVRRPQVPRLAKSVDLGS